MKGNKRAGRSQTSSHTAFSDALYGGIKIFDAAEKIHVRAKVGFAFSDLIDETRVPQRFALLSLSLSAGISLFRRIIAINALRGRGAR